MDPFFQVVNMLLALSGVGIGNNPNPPTADSTLQFAVPDAELIVHMDTRSIVPNNFAVLKGLPDHPEIKGKPELRAMAKDLVSEMVEGHALVKGIAGIDLANDISDVTAFIKLRDKQPPDLLVAINGKIAPNFLKRAGAMAGATVSPDGRVFTFSGSTTMSAAFTKSGTLIAGSSTLVNERASDSWKAPARPAGSTIAKFATNFANKPVFAIAGSLSAPSKKMVIAEAGDNFASDIIDQHQYFSFEVYRDGIGWTFEGGKSLVARVGMMSEGAIDILRAAHIAPRGALSIAFAALESYKGRSKGIDELIKARDKIFAVAKSFSGDGQFAAKRTGDASKVTFRLTGKTLSDVVPAIVPLGAVSLGFVTRSENQKAPMMMPPPSPAQPAPRKGIGASR